CVVAPSPSKSDGTFSTRFVEEALLPIGKAIREKKTFHLVTIISTLLPGAMDSVVKPLLEKISQKKCGVDFGLCYNPEFIALGNILSGFLAPDFVLIGESDTQSGELLSSMYKRFCKNDP